MTTLLYNKVLVEILYWCYPSTSFCELVTLSVYFLLNMKVVFLLKNKELLITLNLIMHLDLSI